MLSIIESVGRATPADIAKSNTDINAAMTILKGLPSINVELWSKLARAAKSACSFALAFDCAENALKILPNDGAAPEAIRKASDAPYIPAQDWFWLSVSATVMGQMTLNSAKEGTSQVRSRAQSLLAPVCVHIFYFFIIH